MSRAFVREDDTNVEPFLSRPPSSLPAGVKNFLTFAGAERLRAELTELEGERARLIASPIDSDTKRQAMVLEQRVRHLQQSLRSAEIVSPAPGPRDRVRFGATVTVRDLAGAESTYRIVGVDEADAACDDISWQSPLAQALLNARPGERVRFEAPRGAIELEVVQIH